jgi:hypothetical protein
MASEEVPARARGTAQGLSAPHASARHLDFTAGGESPRCRTQGNPPAKTPEPVVARLNKAFYDALALPDMKGHLQIEQ